MPTDTTRGWCTSTRKGETIDATPRAHIVASDADVMVRAAVAGAGLALTLASRVEAELQAGTLIGLLADHCPVLPPFCLYYPAGRQPLQAMRTLAAAFRHREGS